MADWLHRFLVLESDLLFNRASGWMDGRIRRGVQAQMWGVSIIQVVLSVWNESVPPTLLCTKQEENNNEKTSEGQGRQHRRQLAIVVGST